VWDTFSPGEAVELVMYMMEEGQSAFAAAEQLCHEAVERAIDSEDGEADNTSAVVIFLKPGCLKP
jgi:serine/threonine protein phosphatase PrpC